MEKQVQVRDTEIMRMTQLYKGGQNFDTVKLSHDKNQTEEVISKQQKQLEFLNSENHRLESEMQEVKELLGLCEPTDPTDKDKAHLKTLVRKMKQRND